MVENKLQVLMSAYNGEKYIRVQLDSILNQTYQNIEILIRDDGSTDSTVSILKEYQEKYENVSFYSGENVGVIGSFFDLINHADKEATYYAFSDQDDYWLEQKLEAAVEQLQKEKEIPFLYCSNTTLVDDQLEVIPMEIKQSKVVPEFGNALVENKATGCTCVINHELLKLLQHVEPEYTVMHDWWIYLAASCFGKVYFDPVSYIYYRQHGGNQVGARNTYWKEFVARFKRFGSNKGKIIRQLRAFENAYEIESAKREKLHIVTDYKKSFKNRLKAILTKEVYRQRTVDNIVFKALFLIGEI
ncbi:alpha-L-Rha alpha-1,3-L-rhamnosyltransferase [Lachnospiraceae bacterium KM106-2]|nr:alpha-L-Rha alpha-1,3-L-rhamnosyltransferase [Lachnospiraceae bacterium KM106-2]